MIKSIETDRLKEVFLKRFEALIVSGCYSIGDSLPSEKELSLKFGVNQSVVREGLSELCERGLLTMNSPFETVVNDFRKDGSLALLTMLFDYDDVEIASDFLESLLDMRMLFEVETARLAAINRTETHLKEFDALIRKEKHVDYKDAQAVSELDFQFHHLTAIASDNVIYPMLLSSIKRLYTNTTKQFFSDSTLVSYVFDFHTTFVEAIRNKDSQGAGIIMKAMLFHGEKNL